MISCIVDFFALRRRNMSGLCMGEVEATKKYNINKSIEKASRITETGVPPERVVHKYIHGSCV